jgi:hypothetical protein
VRFSGQNAEILAAAAALRGCDCQPYASWYTYKRWLAQGMQVQRGERGTKIAVVLEDARADGTLDKRVHAAYVFCACQVAPIEAKEEKGERGTAAIAEAV